MTKRRSRNTLMLQETRLRYRLEPVTLGKYEIPTALKAQDIADGVTEVHVETESGFSLNTYRRWPNPLAKLRDKSALPAASFLAGLEYGKIYRRAWGSQSPPFSDPTRIIVQGGKRSFEPKEGYRPAINELRHLEETLFGVDTRNLLDAVCGLEMSLRQYCVRAQIDRDAAKKRLFEALARYSAYRKNKK